MKKLIILLFTLLAACSTGSKVPAVPLEESRIYNSTYEKVWSAAVEALTSYNLPIDVTQKDSGLIKTGSAITSVGAFLQDAHLYGVRGFHGSIKETVSAQLFIKSVNNASSKVSLKLNIKELGSNGWFNEESKGVLEKKIFDKIQSLLIN